MSVFGLIQRSIRQRLLSSALTALNVALGVMLVCSILLVRAELESTYLRQGEGFSLVVGPSSSSRLQLVLNSVYHVDQSTGLLPWSIYEELNGPRWGRYIKLAVPYSVGDQLKGYRVVATTDGIFSDLFPQPPGKGAEKLIDGRPFAYDPAATEEAFEDLRKRNRGEKVPHKHGLAEAVVGYEVATKLGLRLGQEIEPTHGVEGGEAHDHSHTWTVVGVLKRTGTPVDRVVFINLDSFYRLDDHAGAFVKELDDATISSVLLFPTDVGKAFAFATLSKRGDVQIAEVGFEILGLLNIIGNVDAIFLIVSILVVIIGVVSLMVAIYNTMNERRRELAIMRAIGARRSTVLAAIVGEAAVLSAIGAVLGLVAAHILVYAISDYVMELAGLQLDHWNFLSTEFGVAALVVVAGAIAGLIPAFKAYRTDVAKNLAPLS